MTTEKKNGEITRRQILLRAERVGRAATVVGAPLFRAEPEADLADSTAGNVGRTQVRPGQDLIKLFAFLFVTFLSQNSSQH